MVALITRVKFLNRVYSQMRCQITFLLECFPAVLARKRSFIAVYSQMHCQMSLLLKGFLAITTREKIVAYMDFQMRLQMSLQMSFSLERLAAVLTLKKFCIAVTCQMAL